MFLILLKVLKNFEIQWTLDLVTLMVSAKTVTKLKNGLFKIKLQVVTKFNVTISRLHCISHHNSLSKYL